MNTTNSKLSIPFRANQLAQPGFFPRRFIFEKIVFAEITVGESIAHGVVVNLENHACYCTCPFHPKPCVHALALNALCERENTAAWVMADTLPEWVTALLSGTLPSIKASAPASAEAAGKAKQQRRFERLERAVNGFEDLEAWLLDTARRGLATVVSEDARWWEGIAARMADASMTSLSRTLRLLGQIPTDMPDWADKTTSVLADCYFAVRAFRKRGTLPEHLLFDLQNFIGMAVKKEDVLASGERLFDAWSVLAQTEEPLEDKLLLRRTWLLGSKSGRYALLLDYSFGEGAGFPPGFPPGSIHQGTLAFYPSAFPQRAAVLEDFVLSTPKVGKLSGFPDFNAFAQAYAAALAAQPWLQNFPAVFSGVAPQVRGRDFFIVDKNQKLLPMNDPKGSGWQILSLSGGHPIDIFGEWDGAALRPLSATAEGRTVVLLPK